MADSAQTGIGRVVALWRYPVKSMMGEELNVADITDRGLLGDRMYGLVDRADGKVATAKNPRKWPNLFDYRAGFVEPPRPDAAMPPVRISLPDGTSVTSEQSDHNQILCQALHREVTLEATERKPQEGATSLSEEYWPDMEGLDHRDTVTDFALPEGTFFDIGLVHLLTRPPLTGCGSSIPKDGSKSGAFGPMSWWRRRAAYRTSWKTAGSATPLPLGTRCACASPSTALVV